MLKHGTDISNISPQLCIAYTIASVVFLKHGFPCIITSGNDGLHKQNSLHFDGQAIDLRSKHLTNTALKNEILTELRTALPGFDILLEYLDKDNEHFHCEYDPVNHRVT